MFSGKAHAAATVITAGVASPAIVFLAQQPPLSAIAFAAGCMVGLVVTPDLDVRYRNTYSETIMRHTAGRFVGLLWDILWLPYAYLIPRHRHWLSHTPLLGTALRLLYLLILPALIWWILGYFAALPALPQITLSPVASWALGGLVLVDALHWAMDRLAR